MLLKRPKHGQIDRITPFPGHSPLALIHLPETAGAVILSQSCRARSLRLTAGSHGRRVFNVPSLPFTSLPMGGGPISTACLPDSKQ